MNGRYKIIQDYFGLFDQKTTLCVTDSLFNAVQLCEQLNESTKDRPYDYDFEKVVDEVDDALDFYPGESFADAGYVYDVKNLEDFTKLLLKKKRHPRKRLVE